IVLPGSAEDGEGIGGHAAGPVVGRTHQEPGAAGDGTELADHQMVAEFRVVEQNVVLLKAGGVPLRAVVVGVISDGDIGGLHHVFQKTGGAVLVGKNDAGVWNGAHGGSPFKVHGFC